MKQHRGPLRDSPAPQRQGADASPLDVAGLLGNDAMQSLTDSALAGQAAGGGASGPFDPTLEALLEAAFGPEVAELEVARGEDDRNEAIDAEASTTGSRISLPSDLREDPSDPDAMSVIGEEVSHALAGGGSGQTELDEEDDPGEAKASRAGEAFARFAASGQASGDLAPATGGRARTHRRKDKKKTEGDPDQTDGKASFKELIRALQSARSAKARQSAASALAAWCRAKLPDNKTVEAYIARKDIKAEDKTATLGKLQAALARNEFLLGNAFHGGVDKSWETGGANKGPFVDEYIEQVRLDGQVKRKDAAWCTSFVGTQVGRAGFDFNEGSGGKAGSRSIFWSGARLESWGEDGKNNSGKPLNGKGDQIDDAKDGSALIEAADWKALKASVKKAKGAAGKKKAVDAFFKSRPEPQPGDVVVIGKNNSYRGSSKSHTLMVERYDSSAQVMSLVEGNSKDRVKGRTISLTDDGDLGQIIYTMRLGVQQYDDPGNTKTNKGPAPVTDRKLRRSSAKDVLRPVEDANASLAKLSVSNKWVKTKDADASVSEMVSGKKVNSDDGSSSTR